MKSSSNMTEERRSGAPDTGHSHLRDQREYVWQACGGLLPPTVTYQHTQCPHNTSSSYPPTTPPPSHPSSPPHSHDSQVRHVPCVPLSTHSTDAFINKSEGSRSSGEMSWCKEKSTWRDGLPPPASASHSHPGSCRLPLPPKLSAAMSPNSAHSKPRKGRRLQNSTTNFTTTSPTSECNYISSAESRLSSSPGRPSAELGARQTPWYCGSYQSVVMPPPSRLYLLAIFALILIPVYTNALTGPNVCSKQET